MAQILFLLIGTISIYFAVENFLKIRRNINLGTPEIISGNIAKRWNNVLLVALGQKKMFQNWTPAILHLFIYTAFLITQIELLEILTDGTFGLHRFFSPFLGSFYTFIVSTIEILSVLAFIATIAFLARRFVLKIARFQMPELKGFPTRDAAIILILEIILIFAIFCMNGSDTVLQSRFPDHYHHTGFFAVSGWLGPLLFGGLSSSTLIFLERTGWWMHIALVLAYLNYLPFSKHLHIIFAFINTYYARLTPRGEMANMPEVTKELRSILGMEAETPQTEIAADSVVSFGSNDVTNLSWRNILEAYSCTECGRCTAQCPANLTGKKLSPRKIVMDVRDRAKEIGDKLDSKNIEFINKAEHPNDTVLTAKNFSDGKSLFDYITKEELNACTTCNACVEACPILINPLDVILKMRRYEILTLSEGPSDWIPMFTSLENSGSVWQMQTPREKWATDATA